MKVARIKERGTGVTLGGSQQTQVFDGIFFLERLSGELEIVPFNISRANTHRNLFEVTYRFDMDSDQGQMAFKRAVKGDFLFAEKATMNSDGSTPSIDETGVERLLIEDSTSQTTSLRNRTRLSFVFKRDQNSSYETVETQLTHPDGKVDYFQSLAQNSNEWKMFFAWYEKFTYKISLKANLTQLNRGQDDQNALKLIVEGEIRDSHTTNREWTSYILEVENSLGLSPVLTRAPQTQSFINVGGPNKLGSSQLYYNFQVEKDDILTFLNATEAQRWETLESAFGVSKGSWSSAGARFFWGLVSLPLSVLNIPLVFTGAHLRTGSILYHAINLESKWQEAVEEDNIEDQLKQLGRLFYDPRYGYEVVRIIRTYLDGSPINYAMTSSNQTLGDNRLDGRSHLQKDDQTSFMDQMSSAEKQAWEASTSVSNITLSESGTVKVEFELHNDVHSMNIQFLGRNSSGEITRSTSLYIKSDGETPLLAGKNQIEFDKNNGDFKDLFDIIKYSREVNLKLSVSPQGIFWGDTQKLTISK